MAYKLHSIPHVKYYCSSIFSPATLICTCTYIMIAIIPFLLVASTQNLWVTQVVGVEQLDMNFKNDNNYHISVLLQDTTANPAAYTSYTLTNMFQQGTLNNDETKILQSALTHQDYDYNQDGKVDHLEINIQLTPAQGIAIRDVEAVIFMGYTFKKYTKVTSRGMLRFRTNNIASKNIGGVVFAGSPLLKIRKPLPRAKKTTLQIYNENPFIRSWMLLENIFQSYYEQDFRIDADYTTHFTSCFTDAQITNGLNTQANIKIILELDVKQEVLYNPTFIHLLRDAWVQYFALLFPSIFIGRYFLQFFYKYKFASTYLQDNLPKEKLY